VSKPLLDLSKPLQTRDGTPVEILLNDYVTEHGSHVLVVLVPNHVGRKEIRFVDFDGHGIGGLEIVNRPEPITITRYFAAVPSANGFIQSRRLAALDDFLNHAERAEAIKFRLDAQFLDGKFQSATFVEI
jgi:hypothetical protein